jgi:hypothetical protein
MTDDQLVAAIQDQGAAVVHFSHHADSRPGVVFPGDMRNALHHTGDWSLSCHVLWPGHAMDLVGSIGIILDVTAAAQVLSVSSCDSGSMSGNDGSELSLGGPLTQESFVETFELTGAYNEWRVKGASPKGILVSNPEAIIVKMNREFKYGDTVEERPAPCQISLDDVARLFPECDLYTMSATSLELIRSKSVEPKAEGAGGPQAG